MNRYLLIIGFLFLCLTSSAQSYIGNSKEQIYELVQERSKKAVLSYSAATDSDVAVIKVDFHYETLYYHLEDNVCVKFEVVKPYSCDCLQTDIDSYQEHCIYLGDRKWLSKDHSKIFEIELNDADYMISIKSIDPINAFDLLSANTKTE